MLYDKRWSKNGSLASFIAWLETKDPRETYCFDNHKNCALGQYSRHIGVEPPEAINGAAEDWGLGFFDAVGILKSETFGEALKKARKFYDK